MRRPLLGFALLAGVLGTVTQQASTAGLGMTSQTTAVHRATTVHGATLISLSYTMSGGRITAITPRLRGIGLPLTAVARFGTGSAVECTRAPLSTLNPLTGLGEADYRCLGLTESADRPRPLVITVS